MKPALFLLACLVAPVAASADLIGVQTGEHADFTRVVLSLPAERDWDIRRSLDGYDIEIPGAEGFEVSRFYDLVPRTRITKVAQSADGGTLSLDVTCLCNVDPFVYLDRFLVVDVRDGAPDPQSPFETLPATEPTAEIATMPSGNGRQLQILVDPVIPLFLPPATERAAPPNASDDTDDFLASDLPETATDSVEPVENNGFDVHELGAEIAQSVARALSEGLIGPTRTDQKEDVQTDVAAVVDTLPGVNLRTSREQAAVDVLSSAEQAVSCVPDGDLAFEDWADDRPFNVQFRSLSQNLFAEEQPSDHAALIALARFYLHFGFVDEAVQLIRSDGRNSVETQRILTLAQLLSDQQVADKNFAEQVSCNGRVALWALLAAGQLSPESSGRTAEIVAEYRRLPSEVKAVIGPRLAQIFLAAGDVDSAMQIMGRVPQEGAIEAELTTASSDLEVARNRTEEAVEILDAAIKERGVTDATVLTRRLTLGTDSAVRPDPETVALAEAVLFETKGSEAAHELALAQFRFHLASGNFDAAEGQINTPDIFAGSISAGALKSEFAEAAVNGMGDMAFGRFAWNDDLLPDDPAAREMVAARLDTLGFSERAAFLRGSSGAVLVGQQLAADAAPTGGAVALTPEPSTPDGPNQETRESIETPLARLRALVSTSQQVRAQTTEALAQAGIPAGQ